MSYLALKHAHMLFAALSGIFFLVRGQWMLMGSSLLKRRWARTLPHVIDTLLLASAIGLAVWSRQYPFVQPWLTAKVVALFVYIALGMVALRFGKTKTIRASAYVAALLTFGYILVVARTRNPLFFM